MTASEMESNVYVPPESRLFLLDVATDRGQVIGNTAFIWGPSFDGNFLNFAVSPNAKAVASIKPGPLRYGWGIYLRMGSPRNVQLHWLDGRPVQLKESLPENIHIQTMAWSRDGNELAFFADGRRPINPAILFGPSAADVMPEMRKNPELKNIVDNPARLYRININDGTVTQLETGEMEPGQLGSPEFQWTASGELLFRSPRRSGGYPPGSVVARRQSTDLSQKEWWITERHGHTRLVEDAKRELPDALLRLQTANCLSE